MVGAAGPLIAALPADAAMMLAIAAHWITDRRSCRKARPDSAPSAGSALIRTPKVRVGIRVSANISREYGSALDKTATPKATGRIAGSSSDPPACDHPDGGDDDGGHDRAHRRGNPAVRGTRFLAEDDIERPADARSQREDDADR